MFMVSLCVHQGFSFLHKTLKSHRFSPAILVFFHTIRHNNEDGGMSIRKTLFLKLKLAAKALKKYLTNHVSLIKFAFLPMKIFVSKATLSVKIMNFSIGDIDMSMPFKLQ